MNTVCYKRVLRNENQNRRKAFGLKKISEKILIKQNLTVMKIM